MKYLISLLIVSVFLISCNRDYITEKRSDKRIRKKALDIAAGYAIGQLKSPKVTKEADGKISLHDDQKHYRIDPARIFTGFIDEDMNIDALVSIDVFHGNFQTPSEQLFVFRTGNKYMLNRVIELDMRVMKIEDRIITAEVPTHTRNSPLFNCAECREVVKYQFRSGELIRMD